MTKIQSMVRAYMQLPWHVQIRMEHELGLLEDGDSLLKEHERLKLIFTRVKERDLIDKLISEINLLKKDNIPTTEPAPPLAPENEAVGIPEAVYEGAEQWHSEYDSCRALLQELVDLKNIKDSEGKTTDYEARQPLAWAAAKEFLKKYQHL